MPSGGVTTGIGYRGIHGTGAIPSKLDGIPDADHKRPGGRSVLHPTFRAGW